MKELPDFYGTDYVADRDYKPLSTQHLRVRSTAIAWPGGWFTWSELSAALGGEPPGSVERQVRYLRDARFGGYVVEKRVRSGRTNEYRVVKPFRLT